MKVLVIQGAGMNMRGKVDIEIFGSMTLEQLNDTIRGYATHVGVDVEFCHSNIEPFSYSLALAAAKEIVTAKRR